MVSEKLSTMNSKILGVLEGPEGDGKLKGRTGWKVKPRSAEEVSWFWHPDTNKEFFCFFVNDGCVRFASGKLMLLIEMSYRLHDSLSAIEHSGHSRFEEINSISNHEHSEHFS